MSAMSVNRFRVEVDSQARVGCNLCGSNGASVRCDKCDSMAFCLSCDDMYHRHPKRRYHLRKAVALDRPKLNDNLTELPQLPRLNVPPTGIVNNGHPSKMPVPPPRRKKKGITLSSIKETFANTGDRLRRWVSNEKLSAPTNNKYQTEYRPIETPMIQKPMETIRTQTLNNNSRNLNQNQNQMRTFPKTNSFGTLPVNDRELCRSKNSYPPPRVQEPLPAPPIPPPPLGPKPVHPNEAVYQNFRKTSLPSDHRLRNAEQQQRQQQERQPMRPHVIPNMNGRTKIGVSSSIGDLSADIPSADYQRKFSVNTFDRRNCSLHDLRRQNTSIDDISDISGQPFHPQMYPQNGMCCGPYSVHPWVTSSLNNSIEDMQLNDVEDYDSDASARHHSTRMKRASIKRAQSAFQMYPGMGQCCHGSGTLTPMQPYPYPYPYYPYGHPCSGHTSPMPPYATPHRAQSFKMNSRSSVDNMSTTSSSRDISSKDKHRFKKKSHKLDNKDLSDSGGRSLTSSSRQQSDFDDDDDHFFSVSEDDSSDSLSIGVPAGPGQWSCK